MDEHQTPPRTPLQAPRVIFRPDLWQRIEAALDAEEPCSAVVYRDIRLARYLR
jgi:hypothetical protein